MVYSRNISIGEDSMKDNAGGQNKCFDWEFKSFQLV